MVRQAAFDTARTAARLPGTRRVRLVSLETLEEMPADTVEIREGDEEGVERLNGWGPTEIARDPSGAVTGIVLRRCVRVYDDARRFAPVWDDTCPFYGFFGAGLALYFASQGAGRLLWPLLAGFARMTIAIGGGWLVLHATGSLSWMFLAVGVALAVYGAGVAAAVWSGVWFSGARR